MGAIVQYNVTNTAEFIQVDGVVGTSVAGVSYSLQKNNIVRFTVNASNGTFGIAMLDNVDYWFTYTELLVPGTSNPYASLVDAVNDFKEFANDTSTSYTSNFFSVKTTLGLVSLRILPTLGAGWVCIKADAANTGIISIGDVNMLVAGSTYEIAGGESITIETAQLSDIYLLSATNNQVFYLIGSSK